jgi:FMN phosphatase YigB (HAD superfamily)
MAATSQMMQNHQPDCTLEQVFDAAFFPKIGLMRETVQPAIDDFYKLDFPGLVAFTRQFPDSIPFIEVAFERGYRVGVATTPLFPRVAISQRLAWAGLPEDHYPYALVPSYEVFHFAKPNPAYLAEFLALMGWPEGPILTIGDDPAMDIFPARQLGIPVYWIQDSGKVEWPENSTVPPHGSLREVFPWLDSMPAQALLPEFNSPTAILAILLSTPACLGTLLKSLNALDLAQRPKVGEWSPAEIICHLRDVDEEVNLPRLRKIIREDNPFIAGQETDLWAEQRHYQQQDGKVALDAFIAHRMELHTLLQGLDQKDWQRPARHAIFGPTQLMEIASIIAGHDRLHVRQMFASLGRKLPSFIRSEHL